jgi:hypothetical protein
MKTLVPEQEIYCTLYSYQQLEEDLYNRAGPLRLLIASVRVLSFYVAPKPNLTTQTGFLAAVLLCCKVNVSSSDCGASRSYLQKRYVYNNTGIGCCLLRSPPLHWD